MSQACKSPLDHSQRTYRKTRKVKTGCSTCKIRKVKCDEARPSCRRCTSTGRACEGYGIWGGGENPSSQSRSSRTNVFPVPKEPLSPAVDSVSINDAALRLVPLHDVSADEQTHMEWFISRTTRKMSGAFKSAFWNILLPQASYSESAVLHAVLSLGSVHKSQALSVDTSSESSQIATAESFTLQQYNHAIGDLRRRIENKNNLSNRVALITCAIFVQLEYLRGCYKTALTHLRHGLLLLEELLGTNGMPRKGSHDVADECILQAFTTLVVQAELWGQELCSPAFVSHIGNHLKPLNEAFRSLSHARLRLEHIYLRIISLNRQGNICTESVVDSCSSTLEFELNDVYAPIEIELEMWLKACESATLSANNTDASAISTPVDKFAWKLLRIYHTLACIMVEERPLSTTSDTLNYPRRSHSTPTNKPSDALTPLFHSILAQCEHLFKLAFGPSIQTAPPTRQPADRDTSHAIADIGWIPPLYYIAVHSRDPDVRRKAITMLRLVPHREGIWDSMLAAAVAEKVLDVEQSSQVLRWRESVMSEDASVQKAALDRGSDKDTVRDVRVELPEGPNGRMLLKFSMGTDQGSCWITPHRIYDLRSGCWIDNAY